VNDAVFDRYKQALKAGHVAVLRGRLEQALERYEEAARLADSRPLPYSSMAGVLLRLGRLDEAIAAYDQALRRAPADEAALSGRSEALLASGRRNEAAATLDQLAELQARNGRQPDALATRDLARTIRSAEAAAEAASARQAAETAEAERLATEAAAARAEAERLEAERAEAERAEAERVAAERRAAESEAERAKAAAEAGRLAAEAEAERLAAEAESRRVADAAEAERLAAEAESRRVADAARSFPMGERFVADAEGALDAGDRDRAVQSFVEAAAAFAAGGSVDAAIDACQHALTAAPGSAAAHLWLARLYFERGWNDRAVEKVLLLERLLDLEPDDEVREGMLALAREHAAEEPGLAAVTSAALTASAGPLAGSPPATASQTPPAAG
jgi:tetratricopeptide (TPR) repeat protein